MSQDPRLKIIFLNSSFQILSKVIQFFSIMVSVPWVVSYLSIREFALYLSCSSIVGMSVILDFGISYGLINRMAKLDFERNGIEISDFIKQVFGVLTIFGLFFSGLIFLSYLLIFRISLNELLGVNRYLIVMMLCVAFSIPGVLFNRVLFALQKGYVYSGFEGIGHLLGVFILYGLIVLKFDLTWIVGSLFFPMFFSVILSILYLLYNLKGFSFALISRHSSSVLSSLVPAIIDGLRYFLPQLVILGSFAFDNILILNVCGSKDAADYGVMQKLMGILVAGFSMIIAPLWPAMIKAKASGAEEWSIKISRLTFISSIIFGAIAGVLLGSFGDKLGMWWSKGYLAPASTLVVGFGLWIAIILPAAVLGIIVNTIEGIRGRLISISCFSIVLIIFFKLIGLYLWGSQGLVYFSTMAYFLFVAFPYYILAKKNGR